MMLVLVLFVIQFRNYNPEKNVTETMKWNLSSDKSGKETSLKIVSFFV